MQLSPSEIPKQRPSLRDWVVLRRFAGKAFGDLFLTASEAKRSELKVSLVNQGKRSIIVKKWEGSAGYDVQVRSADGKPVPLSEKGKTVFQGGASLDIRELKPQEKIEQSMPINELFDMKAPGEYTVLVSLPVIGDVDAVLTTAPVKVRVDAKSPAQKK